MDPISASIVLVLKSIRRIYNAYKEYYETVGALDDFMMCVLQSHTNQREFHSP